jgi:hypothetical protein
VAEEKEVRTGVVFEREECSYDRAFGERAGRKFKSIRQRREKSRAVTACATAQFFGTKLIQPLVALPPTQFSDVTLVDNLIGRGEVAPVENA